MTKTPKSQLLSCIATALAIAFVPAPALAESASISKTEAILGGSSKLAALLAAQQGQSVRPTQPVQQPLRPASLSSPPVTYAVLRKARSYNAAATGRPDVFGSVALSVGRTPLDKRWHQVASKRVTGAAASYAASLRGRGDLTQIEAVNAYVNRKVTFVDDSRQYGREDFWSAASETLRRGRGDCEDYAIAKLQMLRAAGFADRDLYLVIAKDLVRRSDHALLVVRADGRLLVLDNGTDRILDAQDAGDYRPVLTYSATAAWTHGYRRLVPPMQVAAASVAALSPSADLAR
jgi:predicted transglutaminase-like cysteine proteinase